MPRDTCSCLSTSILWFIDSTRFRGVFFDDAITWYLFVQCHSWTETDCFSTFEYGVDDKLCFNLFGGYMTKAFCDIDFFFWSAAIVQFLQSLSNSILMIARPYIADAFQVRLTMVAFMCVFTGLLLDLNLKSNCSPYFHFHALYFCRVSNSGCRMFCITEISVCYWHLGFFSKTR